jgi:hypothetical protein
VPQSSRGPFRFRSNSFRNAGNGRVLITSSLVSHPFPRNPGPQPQKTRVLGPVRIAIDHAFNPFLARIGPMPPVQIKPIRIRVQLDPGAGRGTGIDHRPAGSPVSFAFEQQPPGQMPEHVHISVLRRADQAFRVISASFCENPW